MPKPKQDEFIPLYDIHLAPQTLREVRRTLKLGWLSPGSNVAAFEDAICSLMRMRYGVGVNSATLGLQLALASLGVGRGQNVITSPFTFVATAEAIIATGAVPVFADIDPMTLNIDADRVAEKVNRKTAAVMPVDIAGYPADYDRLKRICKQERVALVVDAAHSIGTRFRGKPIPTHADAAVISFQATKNLICGEGGIVLTRRKADADQIRLTARHGMTSTALNRKTSRKWEYDVVASGAKGYLSEVHAAIGLGQLAVFEKEQARRTRLAERYFRSLSALSEFIDLPVHDSRCEHGWHLFIIRLKLSRLRISRNRFIRLMFESGVECGVHYKPISELSYYKQHMGLAPHDFPNATSAGKCVVTLPLYPRLAFSDVDRICERIADVIHEFGR